MVEFLKFITVGGAATILQFSFLHGLVLSGLARPIAASTTGYLLSALFNYWANHTFTFRSDQAHHIAFPRFVAVVIVGLGLNACLMAVGIHLLGLHYLVAQVFAIAPVVLVNFVLNRHWTFEVGGISQRRAGDR